MMAFISLHVEERLQISYFLIYYENIFSENWELQAISLLMTDFMKSKEDVEEKKSHSLHTLLVWCPKNRQRIHYLLASAL